MTKNEALNMALKALENTTPTGFNMETDKRFFAAIKAIKEALEQPEQEPTYTSTQATNCAGCGEHKHTPLRIDAMGGYVCLTCIDKKLGSLLGEFGYEQPEQEPVVWRNAAIRVGEDLCSVGPFGYYDMTAQQWLDWALSVVTVHTPPPQRKPLTDEQIDNAMADNKQMLIDATDNYWKLRRAYARIIESAHGIKGD